MKNEDIEILDDFSDNQMPNSNIPIQDVNQIEPVAPVVQEESVSEFERMVNEAPNIQDEPAQPVNNNINGSGLNSNDGIYYDQTDNQMPNNLIYNGNMQNDSSFANPGNDPYQQNNDLTITAVYPNGFAVEQNDELENTQVIKPKKKSGGDLYLIIIVAVLAITLVVLLVVFYL